MEVFKCSLWLYFLGGGGMGDLESFDLKQSFIHWISKLDQKALHIIPKTTKNNLTSDQFCAYLLGTVAWLHHSLVVDSPKCEFCQNISVKDIFPYVFLKQSEHFGIW